MSVGLKYFSSLFFREVVEWHPAKLLCVRFDVKPPFADASVVGVAPVSKSSKFDIFGKVNELPSTSREKETRSENEKVNEFINKNKETFLQDSIYGPSLYYVRVFSGFFDRLFFEPPTHLRKDIFTT
jgi:hypothetical protein